MGSWDIQVLFVGCLAALAGGGVLIASRTLVGRAEPGLGRARRRGRGGAAAGGHEGSMMFQWTKALVLHLLAVSRAVHLGATGAVVLAGAALLPWSESPSSQQSFLNARGEPVPVVEPHWTEMLARLTAGVGP